MSQNETRPDRSEDLHEIHAQVLAYCRAVDRRDWDGIRAVYTADGVDHHTGFDGDADAYVAWLKRLLPRMDGTMHMLANHTCRLAADRMSAVSETYGQAVHWGTPGDSPQLNFTSGFRYVDHWLRTEDGWRIRERFAVREWHRDDSGRLHGPASAKAKARAEAGQPGEPDIFDVLLTRLEG